MPNARRISIINGYLRQNAGDAALLSVILAQISHAAPGIPRAVFGMENPRDLPQYEGCQNFGSIRRYVASAEVPKWRRIIRRLIALVWGLVVSFGPRRLTAWTLPLLPAEVRAEVRHMMDSELVVSMGGGYLRGGPGLNGDQNVFFTVLPVLIAHRHGTPVAFAPQSFGPFRGLWQRYLVRRAVGRAALVLAREDESLNWLAGCRLPAGLVRRGVDSGFAFRAAPSEQSARARWGLPIAQTPVIGLTARAWLSAPEQAAYEAALAQLIDHIQRDLGMAVVLIPQVACDYLGDDDRVAQARIAERCQTPPHVITEQLTPQELGQLYSEVDVLIGTRFHSVIFALTHGVPAIAIAYEHKTTGIMRDLGLSSWVVPIERVARTDLAGLLARLLTEHADYRRQLAELMPPYIARAHQTTGQLRSVLRQKTLIRPTQNLAQPMQPPGPVPTSTIAP